MRAYWVKQSAEWARLAAAFADYGNQARTAEALARLDDALREALR